MSYSTEWTAAPFIVGAVLLLLIVPPFALIALVALALVVVAAIAAAVVALPYLLFHAARHRLAELREPREAVVMIGQEAHV